MRKELDWKNERLAKIAALRTINSLILQLGDIEESAQTEAYEVSIRLKECNVDTISNEELTDYLHQACIDFEVHNKKGK